MNLALSDMALPIRLRTSAPMSDAELIRFCAANDELRVERTRDGEIVVMSPAGFDTSKMNQRIGRLLDEWAEADGRGVVTDSSGGYSLPDGSMMAPDAAWVAQTRVNTLSEAEQKRFAPLCPDFVIELRSPSDNLAELEDKMRHWMANGAELAWLVDPIERAVTIYRPGETPEHLVDPSSVVGDGPVSGFCLVMARVWG